MRDIDIKSEKIASYQVTSFVLFITLIDALCRGLLSFEYNNAVLCPRFPLPPLLLVSSFTTNQLIVTVTARRRAREATYLCK